MVPTSSEVVWAFDLGKASIGEAVRQGTRFLHKASLLIPAEFAESRTSANRRRVWRTRKTHKASERRATRSTVRCAATWGSLPSGPAYPSLSYRWRTHASLLRLQRCE